MDSWLSVHPALTRQQDTLSWSRLRNTIHDRGTPGGHEDRVSGGATRVQAGRLVGWQAGRLIG